MKEWISGRNPVYEALRARRRPFFRLLVARGVEEKGRLTEIFTLAKGLRLTVETVQRPQLDRLGENHQGVALECGEYPYANLQDVLDRAAERQQPPFVLVLDALQNPQNMGTLLRTAEAAGIHGVLIPFRRTASVTPAVVHASAGATEHLLVAQGNLAQMIDRLKEVGVWVVGLEGGPGSEPVERVRLDGPLAVVVGNEGEGMRGLTRKSCDVLMRLPMHGQIESLNAAVAGSIVLYLVLQARAVTKH
ncbi:MAG TPA: 23S rRNA (guanosine(2251)-2'-O)-methyltransferase RlmB [Anaerolineaceae bacterium]|nr:23S rRNA (guanosine(2251)-2'-O)-methyltransferase RlmB [Anaerolineaceae bacterium]